MMMGLNGVSAPQPSMMSLSGGNMHFFPPAITSVVVPSLPPICVPFPVEKSGVKIPSIPLNIGMGNGGNDGVAPPPPPSYGNVNGSGDGGDVSGQFAMNVTPSVMMGGPPLASM
eukprot:UN09479